MRTENSPESLRFNIQQFDSLESTNKYCELLNLGETEEFTVIVAKEQTAGIGQRGNHWAAAPGQNLTFSVVLRPAFLPAADQYALTKAVSLAIVDTLAPLLPQRAEEVRIKWPNDIYVDDRKICGILINNHLQQERIAATVVGIGLNVNQRTFPDWVPNPTSLALLTGRTFALSPLLEELLSHLESRYEKLRSGPIGTLDGEYLGRLMKRGKMAVYGYQGLEIRATLTGVNRYGHLQLVTEAGERLSCQMKEIQFLDLTQGV